MPERERSQDPPLPRPFWSGTLAFGLVLLPVNLYLATRRNRVALRMVDQDGTPLSRRYFCSRDGEELSREDIVRGYEVADEEFVLVEDEELDRLAPDKSQEIGLRRFVPLGEIDPMYFEHAYFLVPAEGAGRAYRLLARSMEDAERAGIATFVMRGKEYLVAIIARDGVLRAQTLRFHDELRSAADLGLTPPRGAEAERVRTLTEAMRRHAGERLERSELADRYSERVLARIRRKLEAGEDVVRLAGEEAEPEESGDVLDLMAILKASLEETAAAETTGGATPARRGGAATRAELYQRAKALDIPGRSGMTREQLATAVERESSRH